MNSTDKRQRDIESLAKKVADFAQTLPPDERELFETLEAYFADLVIEEEDDVTGYFFNRQLLDIAARRQFDFEADAANERIAKDAVSRKNVSVDSPASQRTGFWHTLLSSLYSEPRPGNASNPLSDV